MRNEVNQMKLESEKKAIQDKRTEKRKKAEKKKLGCWAGLISFSLSNLLPIYTQFTPTLCARTVQAMRNLFIRGVRESKVRYGMVWHARRGKTRQGN